RGGGPQPRAAGIDSYARKAAEVSRAATDPQGTMARMRAMTAGIAARSPKLADSMTRTSLAGLQYLHSKLPPSPPLDPFDPNAKPLPPPPAQQESFLRAYHAVRDPISVVEAARHGQLSLEGVEALKTVFPPLYQRVQETALQEMAAGKMKDATHQQRLGMGLLLGLPLPEFEPAYIAFMQKTWADAAGQHAAQEAAQRRAKPVNLEKSTPQLATDRVEAGASQ
ncbi:MAG: hypothetical protein WBY94_20300, partial [Polyangiaceae bacterium]